MIVTNLHNLPEAVYNLIAKEYYHGSDADLSVTQIIDAPQIVAIKRHHAHEISEDAIDRVWSLFGSIAHNLLEQHGADNAMVEERLFVTTPEGTIVSGKVDHYQDGVITDYKVTSVWSIIYGSREDDWEKQLNCYAHLFNSNFIHVHALQVVAILRDWDKNKAANDSSYPQRPILVIPIKLWDTRTQEEYFNERTNIHARCFYMSDSELPECTEEDMWAKAPVYALMKEGRKSAVKLFDNEEDAVEALNTSKDNDNMSVKVRPGKRTRCEGYCSAAPFCVQYKQYREEMLNGNN